MFGLNILGGEYNSLIANVKTPLVSKTWEYGENMLPDISSSCIVSLNSKYNWGPKFDNRAFSVGQLVNYAIRVVIIVRS